MTTEIAAMPLKPSKISKCGLDFRGMEEVLVFDIYK